MKLVQKLPLGLALTACMMMSSCSQEDVQVLEKTKVKNGSSNERAGGPLQGLPNIATTDGLAGNNVFATGWQKHITSSPDNPVLYATGTSTKTNLWGDSNSPWTKPLLNAPGYTSGSANNFVTVMWQKKVLNEFTTASNVKSKIKNLTAGKKYAVTISVASTVYLKNGEPTQYAPAARIEIPGTIGGMGAWTIFDLNGKQAEWVTKTIVFEAQGTETDIFFANYVDAQHSASYDKAIFYSHAFVGQNAIVEVP